MLAAHSWGPESILRTQVKAGGVGGGDTGAHSALSGDLSLVPAPTSGHSQTPAIPAPENLMPSADLCRHWHTHAHTKIQAHKYRKLRNKKKG